MSCILMAYLCGYTYSSIDKYPCYSLKICSIFFGGGVKLFTVFLFRVLQFVNNIVNPNRHMALCFGIRILVIHGRITFILVYLSKKYFYISEQLFFHDITKYKNLLNV